jgi:hypothetical protein
MKRIVLKKLTLRSETLFLSRRGQLSRVKGAGAPPLGIAIGGNGEHPDGNHPNCSIKITRDPGS